MLREKVIVLEKFRRKIVSEWDPQRADTTFDYKPERGREKVAVNRFFASQFGRISRCWGRLH